MSKKVIVPWSGGLDSTALVVFNLESGNIVTAPYFEITNNADKVVAEKKAIEAMLKEPYFASKIASKQLSHHNGSSVTTIGSTVVHLHQFPVWVLCGLEAITSDTEEIQLAYCMNDDAISYIEDMRNVWQSYGPFVSNLPGLAFPFMKWNKEAELDYLEEIVPGLYGKTWSCEFPTTSGAPCGTCVPCKRRLPDPNTSKLSVPISITIPSDKYVDL